MKAEDWALLVREARKRAHIRDIPRSCCCGWRWDAVHMLYRRGAPVPHCAWHDVPGGRDDEFPLPPPRY